MPRDASGNYTLPAGNPVQTGTVIESTWANTTSEDLADSVTNSLSRQGQGGMLAALRGINGTSNAPSYSWTQDTDTGMYRETGRGILWSVDGEELLQLTSDGVFYKSALLGGGGAQPFDAALTYLANASVIYEAELYQSIAGSAPGAWDRTLWRRITLPNVSDAPEADPEAGQVWFNEDTGRQYIWYVDTNGGQWIENGPGAVSGEYVAHGSWELVDSYEISSDAFIEVFHDGFDTIAETAFDANFMYRVDFESVTTSVSAGQLKIELFEGSYISGTDTYVVGYTGVESVIGASSDAAGFTSGYLALAYAGTSGIKTTTGVCEFTNLATASLKSDWCTNSMGADDASIVSFYTGRVYRNAAAACTKFKIYSSTGGTLADGRLVLYRRKSV